MFKTNLHLILNKKVFLTVFIWFIAMPIFSQLYVQINYINSKTLSNESIDYVPNTNCSIPVYAEYNSPTDPHYVLGTCILDVNRVKKANYNNIEILQYCGCKTGGDAIIIYILEEEVITDKSIKNSSNGPLLRKFNNLDLTKYDFNQPLALNQKIVAKVIKMGYDENIRY